MQNSLCLIYLTIFIAFLISAAISDIRSREVDDRYWIATGILGLIAQAILAMDQPLHMIIGIVTDVLLILYMFWDKTEGPAGIMTIVVAFLLPTIAWIMNDTNAVACRNMVTSLMFMIMLGMYHLKLIRGGADVKALMCISIGFPTYITTDGLPLSWDAVPPISYLFNPTLMTLLIALIISMSYSIYTMIENIRNGDWHRSMFSGYWMPIDKARESFVWPIIDVKDGEIIRTESYDDMEEIYDRMKEHGFERILVTPMIPFILPITIGFTFTILFGNPLLTVI